MGLMEAPDVKSGIGVATAMSFIGRSILDGWAATSSSPESQQEGPKAEMTWKAYTTKQPRNFT